MNVFGAVGVFGHSAHLTPHAEPFISEEVMADSASIYPGGRLTTVTGAPVTTGNTQTSIGTLYWTPWIHNRLSLYNGTSWQLFNAAEFNTGLTMTSGKNYDVFSYISSGSPALELSNAWTNDSTRADNLTTQDGIYVKSGAATRRWMGTIRASGTNVTEDSYLKRFVWNAYNRISRFLVVKEATDSWLYSTGASNWRVARATATNCVEWVCGEVGHAFAMQLNVLTNPVPDCFVGISTNAVNSVTPDGLYPQSNVILSAVATLKAESDLGYNIRYWLERGTSGAGSTTFYGDNGGVTQSGEDCFIMC